MSSGGLRQLHHSSAYPVDETADGLADTLLVSRLMTLLSYRCDCCRYIMTINLDGSNLWRIPLVSGEPAGLDYGSHGNLIISENSSTYLVHVGKHVSKLNKPAPIAKTAAGPCKFYPHNNRSAVALFCYHGHACCSCVARSNSCVTELAGRLSCAGLPSLFANGLNPACVCSNLASLITCTRIFLKTP